jgi:hypothetical protein
VFGALDPMYQPTLLPKELYYGDAKDVCFLDNERTSKVLPIQAIVEILHGIGLSCFQASLRSRDLQGTLH